MVNWLNRQAIRTMLVLLSAASYGSCSIAAGWTGAASCDMPTAACKISSACCCQAQRSDQASCCCQTRNTPAPDRSSSPQDGVGTAKWLSTFSPPGLPVKTTGVATSFGLTAIVRFFFPGRSLQTVLCIWRF